MKPLPLRARIAMAIQTWVDRRLDPWLSLIPDNPDPEVSGLFRDAIKRLKEEGYEEGYEDGRLELAAEITVRHHAETGEGMMDA